MDLVSSLTFHTLKKYYRVPTKFIFIMFKGRYLSQSVNDLIVFYKWSSLLQHFFVPREKLLLKIKMNSNVCIEGKIPCQNTNVNIQCTYDASLLHKTFSSQNFYRALKTFSFIRTLRVLPDNLWAKLITAPFHV